ncbi:hypothetical protein [Sphaerisporangium aureirubrum]|uniref:Uncharacterized protein n=1 Tax=Sphaerisporangium aureirubrum TaxID=1544736 RepID=A0ABW1NV46_9ACTN
MRPVLRWLDSLARRSVPYVLRIPPAPKRRPPTPRRGGGLWIPVLSALVVAAIMLIPFVVRESRSHHVPAGSPTTVRT